VLRAGTTEINKGKQQMKNLTADQILRKTFEHLDQVLTEKKESKELRTTIDSRKQGKERKRKADITVGR